MFVPLTDLRKAEFALSSMETYTIPDMMTEISSELNLPHWSRRAVVVSEVTKDHSFFETVLINRGFNIKLICNQNQAINWLKNG